MALQLQVRGPAGPRAPSLSQKSVIWASFTTSTPTAPASSWRGCSSWPGTLLAWRNGHREEAWSARLQRWPLKDSPGVSPQHAGLISPGSHWPLHHGTGRSRQLRLCPLARKRPIGVPNAPTGGPPIPHNAYKGQPEGHAGQDWAVRMVRKSFPDLKFHLDVVVTWR